MKKMNEENYRKKDFFAPDYLLLPRIIIIDKGTKAGPALVYGAIYWFYGLRDGVCIATNATIGKVVAMEGKSVSNAIKKLIVRGYVKSEMIGETSRRDEQSRHRQR